MGALLGKVTLISKNTIEGKEAYLLVAPIGRRALNSIVIEIIKRNLFGRLIII